jgi:hypothetical protein
MSNTEGNPTGEPTLTNTKSKDRDGCGGRACGLQRCSVKIFDALRKEQQSEPPGETGAASMSCILFDNRSFYCREARAI